MMPDRRTQPPILTLDKLEIQHPDMIRMSNGIPLYIINSGEQDVVRVDILFKGGSWYQTYKLQALFTNRLLREGTRRFSSADIAEKLDYYGAWLELASSIEYGYITLYSLNKYLPQTLSIIESIIKEPIFPENELSTLLETNLQQFLINSTKVDYISHRNLVHALFGDSNPCGKLLYKEDYGNINREILCDFYNEFYHSGNCSIYVSGKVSDQTVSLIEEHFGKESFGTISNKISPVSYSCTTTKAKRVFIECSDSLQSSVRLGELSITRQHPDYFKLQVLITLFGGYFGSRLMSNIREDKGYTYGISAGMSFYPGTGVLSISTETANEYVDALINEVYHEIDILHNQKVTDKELSLVKNYMLGEVSRSYESPFSIADAWIFIHSSGLSGSYFEDSVKGIIETTPDDIMNLARLYLDKEKLTEVVAGKNIS